MLLPAMRRLNAKETRETLRRHGLDRAQAPAFAFRDSARQTFYDWHAHPNHQLLFALEGPTQIETEQARYLLPVGRAAWIPAGVRHRTLITDSDGTSLFFARRAVPDTAQRVRILAADPLMREMVVHAMRWPAGTKDPVAASFLRTLALLCSQWLESELPLSLPGAKHPALARAMDDALAHLSRATQDRALKAAGMSERSFRRAFLSETGMTWQAWLTQARILNAMSLLAEGRRVTDVAAMVGYRSMSAFAKSFLQLTGEAPVAYRRRATLAATESN
ncbi:MAG TPA: helix-turn-helix transcriptional regulator [Rhizomicrobium sp.]|jgi:AraC-like DNA-binding protein/mannose-6-phosphate isomerase-like protein (cupin superfamily)